MAFTKKPLKWSAVGIEPSEEKKEQGFGNGEYPAAGHFDYKFHSDYEVIQELQEKAGEVKTINGNKPDEKGNIVVSVDTSQLAKKTDLDGKVDKVAGKGLSTNDYTTDEKDKLAGIATGANKYVHPSTHPATMITEDDTHRFVTDTEKSTWNSKETTTGAQAKVDALAGSGNTKTVKQIDEAFTTHQADYVQHPGTGTTTNSGNTYAVTLNPAPTSYVDKMGLILTVNADSTGPSTINVNGLGAKAIKKANGNDVTSLKVGGIYSLRYNASTGNFILQGEGGSGNAIASDLLSGKTATTDAGDIVGTMPNRGAFNLSLGASVPAGYYSGGTVPVGKRFANGTAISNSSNGVVSISGLAFKPTMAVIIQASDNTIFSTGVSQGGSPYGIRREGIYAAAIPFTVNSNGFTLQATNYGLNYNWWAYE